MPFTSSVSAFNVVADWGKHIKQQQMIEQLKIRQHIRQQQNILDKTRAEYIAIKEWQERYF